LSSLSGCQFESNNIQIETNETSWNLISS
jgi:hypothetical protein